MLLVLQVRQRDTKGSVWGTCIKMDDDTTSSMAEDGLEN